MLILTTFESDEYVFEALRVGASGFLVKDSEPTDVLRCRARARVRRGAPLAERHAPAHRGVRRMARATALERRPSSTS